MNSLLMASSLDVFGCLEWLKLAYSYLALFFQPAFSWWVSFPGLWVQMETLTGHTVTGFSSTWTRNVKEFKQTASYEGLEWDLGMMLFVIHRLFWLHFRAWIWDTKDWLCSVVSSLSLFSLPPSAGRLWLESGRKDIVRQCSQDGTTHLPCANEGDDDRMCLTSISDPTTVKQTLGKSLGI